LTILQITPRAHTLRNRIALHYRPDIDGLRAVAVLGVVLFHAGLGFPGGFVGVDVFFVISGFLITSLILKELRNNTFSFLDFWERRARRILPALAVVTAAILIAGWFLLLPQDYKFLGGHVIALAAFSANIQFWREISYFATASDEKPLLHTWSLSVEEQFYLLIPVVLTILFRFRKASYVAPILLASVIGSFALSTYLVWKAPAAAFYLLPARGWELGAGSLLFFARPISNVRLKAATAWGGLCLILVPFSFYNSGTPFPGISALPPVVGAILLIWSGTYENQFTSVPHTILSSPPLVWVGLLSYSLYLWHWPLFAFTKYLLPAAPPLFTRLSLVVSSFVLAWISLHFIERPFRSRSFVQKRSVIFGLSAGVVIILLLPSFVVWRRNGLPQRFTPAIQRFASARNDYDYVRELSRDDIPARLIQLGVPNSQPQIIVWGDSSAMAILPVVDFVCKEASIGAVAATRSSTPPVLDWFMAKTRFGLNENAPPYNQAIMDYISTSAHRRPMRVILAGRWQYCLRCDDHARFETALAVTIRKIQACGCRVTILKEVPTFPSVDVPKALAIHAMLGWEFVKPHLSRDQHIADTREQAAFFGVLEAQVPGIEFIDPVPFLTDANGSIMTSDAEGSFYRDDYHLSLHGSMCLRDAFRKLASEKLSQ